MEASFRSLSNSSARRLSDPRLLLFLQKDLRRQILTVHSPTLYNHHRPFSLPPLSFISNSPNLSPIVSSQIQVPNPLTPLGFSRSFSSSQFILSSIFSSSNFARIFSGPKGKSFEWNYSQDTNIRREIRLAGGNGPLMTTVLLGWLGSKPKHLKRYVEFYNSRGVHAVTFVASVGDFLSIDLGKKFEERIRGLASELVSWLSESEKDGKERYLFFHTFSNTGWLVYGRIVDLMQSRPGLLERIKGCAVDSGGDPNIDPRVWAAGFGAALLKKQSSSAYPPTDAGARNEIQKGVANIHRKEPLFTETMLLSALEKMFSFLLNLPSVNQRLSKIISIHLHNLPRCPQLYLYSTADKIIPYQSIESLIEHQKRSGKTVRSFNFGTSPHVDHYRTYPNEYSSQLEKFLSECLIMVKKP